MAGSYDDAPSRRIALDGDGSVGLYALASGAGAISELSDSQMANVNSEAEDVVTIGSAGTSARFVWILFPELREVDGIFYAYGLGTDGAPLDVATAPDTTNGRDGTWTQRIADLPNFIIVNGNYRNEITSMAVSNARGVRVRASNTTNVNQDIRALHLYGEISPGETPDRLLFIDEATGLEFTLPRDLGDIPRGSSQDLLWRIENNSASLQANTIQYTTEALHLTSAGWYTHTLPGGSSFQATQQIGSLAAATTSGIITTRRITAGGQAPGLYAARTYLNVASWS